MSKTRILVVDDEVDVSFMLKLTLEQSGEFEVREENDSTRAVASVREFLPLLILMDVLMPELDGGDVAALLDADPELSGIPILFLTAAVLKEEVNSSHGMLGGRRFLAKPVEPLELIRAIHEAMANGAGEST